MTLPTHNCDGSTIKHLGRGVCDTQVLRKTLQCSLPIEVVYSSEADMSAGWREKLEVRLQTLRIFEGCVQAMLLLLHRHHGLQTMCMVCPSYTNPVRCLTLATRKCPHLRLLSRALGPRHVVV